MGIDSDLIDHYEHRATMAESKLKRIKEVVLETSLQSNPMRYIETITVIEKILDED